MHPYPLRRTSTASRQTPCGFARWLAIPALALSLSACDTMDMNAFSSIMQGMGGGGMGGLGGLGGGGGLPGGGLGGLMGGAGDPDVASALSTVLNTTTAIAAASQASEQHAAAQSKPQTAPPAAPAPSTPARRPTGGGLPGLPVASAATSTSRGGGLPGVPTASAASQRAGGMPGLPATPARTCADAQGKFFNTSIDRLLVLNGNGMGTYTYQRKGGVDIYEEMFRWKGTSDQLIFDHIAEPVVRSATTQQVKERRAMPAVETLACRYTGTELILGETRYQRRQ